MWVCVFSSTQFLCPPNSRRWHPGVKGEMGGYEAVTIINNSRVWVRLTVKTWIDHPSQDTSDCHQSPPSVTSPLVNIKTRGGRRARLTFLLLTINLSTKPAPGGARLSRWPSISFLYLGLSSEVKDTAGEIYCWLRRPGIFYIDL